MSFWECLKRFRKVIPPGLVFPEVVLRLCKEFSKGNSPERSGNLFSRGRSGICFPGVAAFSAFSLLCVFVSFVWLSFVVCAVGCVPPPGFAFLSMIRRRIRATNQDDGAARWFRGGEDVLRDVAGAVPFGGVVCV